MGIFAFGKSDVICINGTLSKIGTTTSDPKVLSSLAQRLEFNGPKAQDGTKKSFTKADESKCS